MSNILVVGSMAFDDIETPFGKSNKIIGGAATYIAYTASYFTQNIQLVSVVGGDFPVEVIQDLESRGVNAEGLQIKADEKSFFWSGKYHLDMNTRDTLITELNVLGTFDPVLPESYKNADFVMLGNLSPDVQRKVVEQMNERPKLVAMDTMNFWMDIAREELDKTLKMVDVLIINDEETRQLTGEHSLVKGAKKIFEMGPKYLIIKKGEHGALLFHGDQIFFTPALPLEEVFDPTGAGDTFAGGFMGYMAKAGEVSFENMKRGVVYGSAMASFCVEKFGTQRMVELSQADIDERLQRFIDLSHVTFEV
ncbi:MAG: PfkB family carbohydrate kinase [Chitinophagales bacterium]